MSAMNFPSWMVKLGTFTLNRRGISLLAIALLLLVMVRWISVLKISMAQHDGEQSLEKSNVCFDMYISSLQSQLNNRLVFLDGDLKEAVRVIGTGSILGDIESKQIYAISHTISNYDEKIPWLNFLTPVHKPITSDILLDPDSGMLRRVSVIHSEPSCVIMDEKFYGNANNGHALVQDITIINDNIEDAVVIEFEPIPFFGNEPMEINGWRYMETHDVHSNVPANSRVNFRSIVAFIHSSEVGSKPVGRALLSVIDNLENNAFNDKNKENTEDRNDAINISIDNQILNDNETSHRDSSIFMQENSAHDIKLDLNQEKHHKRNKSRKKSATNDESNLNDPDTPQEEKNIDVKDKNKKEEESRSDENQIEMLLQSSLSQIELRGHEDLYHSFSNYFASSQGRLSTPLLYSQFLLTQALPVSKEVVNLKDGCFKGEPRSIEHDSIPTKVKEILTFIKMWNNIFVSHSCEDVFSAPENGGVIALKQFASAVMGVQMLRNIEVKLSPGWHLLDGVSMSSRHLLWSHFDVSVKLTRFETKLTRLDRSSEPLYVHERGGKATLLPVNTEIALQSDTLILSPSPLSTAQSQFGDDQQRPLLHKPSTSTSLIVFVFVTIAGFHVVLIRMVYKEYCSVK
eukprot:m.64183 g.64183  ORF g.64183 m.64183 type:complete len:629 (+) comp8105_c0_seq2:216-2102(+)